METQRFFSKVPGASFVFPDGTKVTFDHGFLDIDEKKFPGIIVSANPQFKLADDGKPRAEAYAAELDNMCKMGNPLFFTQGTVKNLQDVGKEIREDVTNSARSEHDIAITDSAMRAVAGRVSGDVNNGPLKVEGSTVDPALQAVVFAPRPDPVPQAQAQQSRGEQLKAEAIARQQKR